MPGQIITSTIHLTKIICQMTIRKMTLKWVSLSQMMELVGVGKSKICKYLFQKDIFNLSSKILKQENGRCDE